MHRRISFTYLGMIAGFLALLLLNCSVWLEMRINTSLVLPIFTLAGCTVSFFSSGKIPLSAGLALQATVLSLFLARYGLDAGAVTVMPAILLREGYHLHFLDIRFVNMLLVIVIFFGNLSAHDGFRPAAYPRLRRRRVEKQW